MAAADNGVAWQTAASSSSGGGIQRSWLLSIRDDQRIGSRRYGGNGRQALTAWRGESWCGVASMAYGGNKESGNRIVVSTAMTVSNGGAIPYEAVGNAAAGNGGKRERRVSY